MINKTIAEIEKKYNLEKADITKLKVVDTGSLTLNKATGCGGAPLGKIIELFGLESSGKSTISLHIIAEFQKAFTDKKVALLDYENSFDREYAENLGVNCDELLIYQPESQEIGYDLAIDLIQSEKVSLIVIDSHTAAIPKKIIDGDMSEATMAMQARNNSKFLGKVKGLCNKCGCTILAISQTRVNIGGYGDVNQSTGGVSWKFYADMRWKVSKSLDKDKELNETTLQVIKNKCGKPFLSGKFNIIWGQGIDKIGEMIDVARDLQIMKLSGSWYLYNGVKIQGKDAFRKILEDNPELYDKLKSEVHELLYC